MLYYLIAASIALTIRIFVKVPDELFRKLLHFTLLGSIFVFIYGFETWWISALAAIIFEVIVFPILLIIEKRVNSFTELTTEL